MTIAYLISAHTDPAQLKRLTEALHSDAHFFVHIDRKSDLSQFTNMIHADNVHFISNRIDVRWGTILEVEYQMALIQAAVDYPVYFDHIFFLSGLDYPLWSNRKITEWLEQQGDREIISGFDMASAGASPESTIIYRLTRPFFCIPCIGNKANQRLSIICRKTLAALGVRKPLTLPNGWHLYKGAAWWCISENLARFVLSEYQNKPEIKRYFTNSFGQAETLIQTIVFNNQEWKKRALLFSDEYPGLVALTPLHFIIYKGAIRIMSEIDYDMLLDSGKMFTRKLTSDKSMKLIAMLNEHRKED